MKTLNLPTDMTSVNIDGEEYTPDGNGQIHVVESHVKAALSVGCSDPDVEVIVPVVPTELLQGGEEAVSALIHENEALKSENRILAAQFEDVTGKLRGYIDRIATLETENADLRTAAAAAPPAPVETATGDTESHTGAQDDASGGESTADTADASGDASSSADDGRVVPDFETMEYNGLLRWLKDNEIAHAHGIKKTVAVDLCKQAYADKFGTKE